MPGILQLMEILIGTYTKGLEAVPEAGGGILATSFDPATGKFSRVRRLAELNNASWFALADEGRHLFAAAEQFDSPGAIHAFEVGPGCELTPRSAQAGQGQAHCHLSVTRDHVYAASYAGGHLSSFPRRGAEIGSPDETIFYEGSGPHERQQAPHAHQAVVSPEERWLYVCDLGSDCVWRHALVEGVPGPPASLATPRGSGPRHLCFHPSLPLAYVWCELEPFLLTYAYDAASGDLTPTASLSLHDMEGLEETGAGAAIHFHPSQELLGLSERAEASVCLFAVNNKGALSFRQRVSFPEKTPRDFAFTPDGHWLLVAAQDSHAVFSYELDAKLTAASAPADRIAIGAPTRLLVV